MHTKRSFEATDRTISIPRSSSTKRSRAGVSVRSVERFASSPSAIAPGQATVLDVHPNEFDESWLVQPDDPIFPHDQRSILEVTESVPLTHFAYCHSVLREIRGKGVALAVDDLGAGYSNLKYIADLRPEIVKLDRTLIADLATDKRLQILVCISFDSATIWVREW